MATEADRVDRDSLTDLRVLAHPLRLRLLSLLTGQAMSGSEAARHLGEQSANVSYHLRRLEVAGLVKVVSTERIRGGTAKRFQYFPPTQPLRPTRAEKGADVLQAVLLEVQRRLQSREMELGVVVDAEVRVPQEIWQQALNTFRATSALLHASAMPDPAEGAVKVSASVVAFQMVEVVEGSATAER